MKTIAPVASWWACPWAGATLAALLLAVAPGSARAQTNIWGNNAGSGADVIEAFDATTGVRTRNFTGVNGNGRGVVVVGNTVYYTVVGDPRIYTMDATTGLQTGSILTTVQSMSTIAWDGSSFWTSDYGGTNRAFQINLSGTVIKTINLTLASSNMDGMEWFDNKLISNRCDACTIYDVYDLNGNVLQSSFITLTGQATGIAFDGTDFLVAHNFNSIDVFNGASGAFLRTIALTPSTGHLIEDLSVDYSIRTDIPGNTTVPEPSTILLMASGLLGLALVARRKRSA